MFAISGGIAIIFYYFLLQWTSDLDKTRTMFMVFLCLEALFLALSIRSFRKSIFRKDIWNNHWLTSAISISFLMVLGAVYLPTMQKILSTVPLSFHEWFVILPVNSIEIIFIDRFKLHFFLASRKNRKKRNKK